MDRVEWWIRFVMGALFGVFVGVNVAFSMHGRGWGEPLFSPTWSVVIMVGCTLFCGVGAAKKADRFWRIFFGHWWRWLLECVLAVDEAAALLEICQPSWRVQIWSPAEV
jgi:hypothetical protein